MRVLYDYSKSKITARKFWFLDFQEKTDLKFFSIITIWDSSFIWLFDASKTSSSVKFLISFKNVIKFDETFKYRRLLRKLKKSIDL